MVKNWLKRSCFTKEKTKVNPIIATAYYLEAVGVMETLFEEIMAEFDKEWIQVHV